MRKRRRKFVVLTSILKSERIKTMNEEIWKPVPGYEGYYSVSNLGRIRREEKKIDTMTHHGPIQRTIRGKIIKQFMNSNGYMSVTLSKNGKGITMNVHSLVMKAFNKVDHYECINHIDHNKMNNCLGNLEYSTQHNNVLHYARSQGMPMYKVHDLDNNVTYISLRQAVKILKKPPEIIKNSDKYIVERIT